MRHGWGCERPSRWLLDKAVPNLERQPAGKLPRMDTLAQLHAGELPGCRRLDLSADLAELPREIFDLADSLEILNLTGNRLSQLPDDLPRLYRLKVLFCSENQFEHLPEVLGKCDSLTMVGFKSNRISSVPGAALSDSLRWLILTDNRIGELPSGIGRCKKLSKLMLAGNRLERLPDEMAACEDLELIRLSANRFEHLPQWLFELPRLAWLGLGGNPWSKIPPAEAGPQIDWADLRIGMKLGEGASGVIHRAEHVPTAREVAVKVFKGAMTSDGLPESEIATCLAAGQHPNLIGVLATVSNHPEGRQGLVMPLIDPAFTSLAGPPSLETRTRDVYGDGLEVPIEAVIGMARGLASLMEALHSRLIAHGDFYAHNILWKGNGECVLGDFGAASFHPPGSGMEKIEVRAFGILLGELLDRCDKDAPELRDLQQRCLSIQVQARPDFASLLRSMSTVKV